MPTLNAEDAILVQMLSQVFEKHNGLANVSLPSDKRTWHDCFQYVPSMDKFILWYNDSTGSTAIHSYQVSRN
jgi:hypothetical protein